MRRRDRAALRVAVAGLGAAGLAVAERLVAGVDGLVLSAVSARDEGRARTRLEGLGVSVPILALEALADEADVVVECTPAEVFPRVAEPAVEAGRVLVAIGVAALMEHLHLVERAAASGARILVPSGALLGLDAVRAAAEGEIRRVRMITRKPPDGLRGAPYLIAHGIEVAGLEQPLKVFSGSAREGAAGFPANLNVAAALGLAGIGLDRTELEIWADPTVSRNCHRIEVEADGADFRLEIENVPSAANPRTGRIVAMSIVATLRRLVSPLVIGT
ncbi:MAG: aspartate dehydrogenase [Gammaproteobacteria bacterium]|nr:aspartate dehydrogenase [Gammaproteobacteria bacterium]